MPKEYRTIQEVAGPLMLVQGVENVTYDELGEIELANGEKRRCKVLEIDGGNALVQLFESSTGINLSNSKVRFLGRSMELGVSEDMLARAVSPRTKAIVLSSPNNPTGCVLNRESLAAVAALAKTYNLFVICDEVYRQLFYGTDCPQFSTLYPDLKDRVVVIQSFSKPYAMTGWRVGYLMADRPVKRQLEKLHQYDVVSTVSFVQEACRAALREDPTPMVETYRRRRDFALARLSEMGLSVVKPEGAFYIFPDISPSGLSSGDFCRRMIAEAGVAAVPGFCFGGEGHIRLSYCCDDAVLAAGLDRLSAFVDKLKGEGSWNF